jgi:tetratricopeptide (TPR) repeat protein
MKRVMILVLVVLGVGVCGLIYTGRSISDVLPLSFLRSALPSRSKNQREELRGPTVQKFSLEDRSRKPTKPAVSPDIPKPVDGKTGSAAGGTQVAMVDHAADPANTSAANPKEEADRLLKEAKKLLREGKTGEAKVKLRHVQGLRCGQDQKREAQKLADKAVPLFGSVFEIDAEPMEGAKTYKLYGGGEIHGWIAKEDARTVTVRMEDGGQVMLARENISRTIAHTSTERLAKVTVQYLDKKKKVEKSDALGQYDLATFCRQKGLNKEAANHLESAFELDNDVRKAVRNREAKNLYMLAVYFGSLGKAGKEKEYEAKLKNSYPESQYLAMLGEEMKMPERKPVASEAAKKQPKSTVPKEVPVATGKPPKKYHSTPKTTPRTPAPTPMNHSMGGSGGTYETQANKHYQAGLKLYRKSLPLLKSGSRSFDGVNKRAMNEFQKAVDYYQKAKSSGQASANIDAKMAQANSLKYGCYKMARVR